MTDLSTGELWVAIVGLALVNAAFKAAGPLILGDRELPPRVRDVIGLFAPALLTGLVLVNLLGDRWRDLDPTAVLGVLAAAGARTAGAPIPVALLAGVLLAALLRLL